MAYKTICKNCKKHKRVGAKGFCTDCIASQCKQAITEMIEHKGPAWDKWKQGYRKFLAKQEITGNVKICPKCLAEQKKTAKRCNICKFSFKDYSKAL